MLHLHKLGHIVLLCGPQSWTLCDMKECPIQNCNAQQRASEPKDNSIRIELAVLLFLVHLNNWMIKCNMIFVNSIMQTTPPTLMRTHVGTYTRIYTFPFPRCRSFRRWFRPVHWHDCRIKFYIQSFYPITESVLLYTCKGKSQFKGQNIWLELVHEGNLCIKLEVKR